MFWAFARTSPEARERFMRFSFYLMLLVGGLYMFMAIRASIADRKPRMQRQAAFVSWCTTLEHTLDECEAFVDDNHDDCYTLSGGGAGEHLRSKAGHVSTFDPDRYQRCVYVGVDAWRVERAAEVKAEAKRERIPELE